MQRLPLRIIIAILPLAALAGSPAGLALAQSPQGDRIVSQEEVAPPLLQETEAGGDNQFDLASAAQAPVTFGYERHLSIHSDMTVTDVVTQRLKILVPAAIQTASQQQISFVEGMQTLDIVEAYTEKTDGRRLMVEPTNIITRDAASGEQLIYLRDQKAKTIIFPDAAVGDTLVFTVRLEHLRPMLARQFSDINLFPRILPFSSAHVTIEAPATLDLAVKTTGDGTIDKVETVGEIVRHDVTIVPVAYRPEQEAGSVSLLDRIRPSSFQHSSPTRRSVGPTAVRPCPKRT